MIKRLEDDGPEFWVNLNHIDDWLPNFNKASPNAALYQAPMDFQIQIQDKPWACTIPRSSMS
jgi:hypothetical protein